MEKKLYSGTSMSTYFTFLSSFVRLLKPVYSRYKSLKHTECNTLTIFEFFGSAQVGILKTLMASWSKTPLSATTRAPCPWLVWFVTTSVQYTVAFTLLQWPRPKLHLKRGHAWTVINGSRPYMQWHNAFNTPISSTPDMLSLDVCSCSYSWLFCIIKFYVNVIPGSYSYLDCSFEHRNNMHLNEIQNLINSDQHSL